TDSRILTFTNCSIQSGSSAVFEIDNYVTCRVINSFLYGEFTGHPNPALFNVGSSYGINFFLEDQSNIGNDCITGGSGGNIIALFVDASAVVFGTHSGFTGTITKVLSSDSSRVAYFPSSPSD